MLCSLDVNNRAGLVPSPLAYARNGGPQRSTYTFHKFAQRNRNHVLDICIQVVSLDPRSSFPHSDIHHIRTEISNIYNVSG
jgi:hypothetical protein